MNTPDTEREERELLFLKDFRAGKFINEKTGLQNPFEIETWWNNELTSRDTYWKERVRKEVEKKQKQVSGEKRLNAGLPNTQVFLDGYNHALNDIITLIERI